MKCAQLQISINIEDRRNSCFPPVPLGRNVDPPVRQHSARRRAQRYSVSVSSRPQPLGSGTRTRPGGFSATARLSFPLPLHPEHGIQADQMPGPLLRAELAALGKEPT